MRTALSTPSRVVPVTNIERTEDRTGLARMASGPDKKRHNDAARIPGQEVSSPEAKYAPNLYLDAF